MSQKTIFFGINSIQKIIEMMASSKLRQQFLRFLVSGFSAVGTDTIVYFIILNFLGHSPAKAISFVAGSIVAFTMNKFYTFKKHNLSLTETTKFIILYVITLLVNVVTNAGFLKFLGENLLWIAFLIAASISTGLNFFGQKFWVFEK